MATDPPGSDTPGQQDRINNSAAMRARAGQVLVSPSKDPATAFRREIAALLDEGHEQEAFGLCVGLAMLTCERVEVLWAERALDDIL